MAAIFNFLSVVVFLSLIAKGSCQCTLDDVTVSQAKTGVLVQNKPEWNVTITNNCPCSQLDLKLACDGFQTLKNVDPLVLAKSGNECLINNGAPVYPFSSFNFTYAWDTSFPLKPLSSQPGCS